MHWATATTKTTTTTILQQCKTALFSVTIIQMFRVVVLILVVVSVAVPVVVLVLSSLWSNVSSDKSCNLGRYSKLALTDPTTSSRYRAADAAKKWG